MVISDTSPLNYLILIGCDDVLPQLYHQVVAPVAVLQELQHSDTPRGVAQWVASPPPWLRIEEVGEISDPALNELGAGEREAILLAQRQIAEVLLLMDEVRGRAEAKRRGIVLTGTLGILDAGAEAGLLNLPEALNRLRTTSFYVAPILLKRLLEKDAVRRNT
jgi:predicted nucleic acid-binding protein